jgi:branched-chain amino acid transport system ATP-binding protein
MLEMKNINVSYGESKVLKDLSLRVENEEVVTVIGSNASGKSTLLKTISGFLTPSNGSILYDGKEIMHLPPHKIAKLGISHVQEGKKVFPTLSVDESLTMGSILSPSEQQTRESYELVLRLFPRLKERLKQKAGTLSGGERQMLMISMGLMSCPKLLMLDEPSHGLAPNLVDEMFEKIIQIHKERGVSVLLVEQNAVESLEMANRGYVLENGRIVMEGTGDELLKNDAVKKSYLGI